MLITSSTQHVMYTILHNSTPNASQLFPTIQQQPSLQQVPELWTDFITEQRPRHYSLYTRMYINKTEFSLCIPATRERGQICMVTTARPNKPLAAEPLSVLAVSPNSSPNCRLSWE